MWQSGLAGVVLSMQSAYTVRIVFASPLPMSRSASRIWAVTRVIIGHRLAELGKVIGDPLAPPAILNGVAPGATIIPVKASGETFSILDLIAALYYVGRLRETGEITRPIVVNMSLGTDPPSPASNPRGVSRVLAPSSR